MRRGSSTKCYSNFKVNLTAALTLCRTRSAKTHGAASVLSPSLSLSLGFYAHCKVHLFRNIDDLSMRYASAV